MTATEAVQAIHANLKHFRAVLRIRELWPGMKRLREDRDRRRREWHAGLRRAGLLSYWSPAP